MYVSKLKIQPRYNTERQKRWKQWPPFTFRLREACCSLFQLQSWQLSVSHGTGTTPAGQSVRALGAELPNGRATIFEKHTCSKPIFNSIFSTSNCEIYFSKSLSLLSSGNSFSSYTRLSFENKLFSFFPILKPRTRMNIGRLSRAFIEGNNFFLPSI